MAVTCLAFVMEGLGEEARKIEGEGEEKGGGERGREKGRESVMREKEGLIESERVRVRGR